MQVGLCISLLHIKESLLFCIALVLHYLCNMKNINKVLKWTSIAIASPVALFLLLAVMLYMPPVQNFIVHKVAKEMSSRMAMNISVDKVRLAFPLDLALFRVSAVQNVDTLLNVDRMRLTVKLFPLFEGRADVDGFMLYGLNIDTKSYLPDTRIKGKAAELTAATHGVDWKKEIVNLDHAYLRDANFLVELSDTAKKDTTVSKAKWVVNVAKVDIEHSKARIVLPGDTMHIGVDLGKASLRKGVFDTGKNDYAIHSFTLRSSAATYDVFSEMPLPSGIDPNHVAITDLTLLLDTLSYTSQGNLHAGVRALSMKEKSGFHIQRLHTSVCMDSARISLPSFSLRTPYSFIEAVLTFDFSSLTSGKGGRSKALIDASIGAADIKTLAAGYVEKQYLRMLPPRPLVVKSELRGNIDNFCIPRLLVEIPSLASLTADGYLLNALQYHRSGNISFNLKTRDLSPVRQALPTSLRNTLNVPNGFSARGKLAFRGDAYDAHLTVHAGKGHITSRARLDTGKKTYNVAAVSRNFPLSSFIKNQKLSSFTGQLHARGRNFDVLSPRATLKANARIDALSYQGYELSGSSLQAQLKGSNAVAVLHAYNPLFQGDATLKATLRRSVYDLDLKAVFSELNLHQLGISTDTLSIGTSIQLRAMTNKQLTDYTLNGSIRDNRITTPKMSAMAKDIFFDLASNSDTTSAFVSAGDLRLCMNAKGSIPSLTTCFKSFYEQLSAQAKSYNIDQEKLKKQLPSMLLTVDVGQDNPLYNIARMKGYSFSSAMLHLQTHPNVGINGDVRAGNLNVEALLLDTIDAHIFQDTTGVQLAGFVKNGKKNPNPLEVRAKSYLMTSGAGIELSYIDSDGQCGVNLGLQAKLQENGINVHFYPQHPVLAYRSFTVNKDNYIFLGNDKSISANVDLLADDGTGLKIYGEPKDSVNDITLSVNQVNLAELSTVLPYMPKLSGMLSGDVHVTNNWKSGTFSAMSSLSADGFAYESIPLGNVGIDAIYLPKRGGEHHASAFVSLNDDEVLACNGTYFDKEEGHFDGNVQLHGFPLQMLNGFMAGTDVAFKGIAEGELNVSGTVNQPNVNGILQLDSVHVFSDVYGFDFVTNNRALEIVDSRILFNDYNLYSTGKNPLVLDGSFDMSNFDRMRMDFSMKANEFELINTRKKAKSMLFGKVYANYMGTLKGTVDNLALRGKLEILDRTDVTYILKDSPLSVDDRLHDLVQFTNFADTTQTFEEPMVSSMGIDLTMGVSISDAAIFHCSLSDDGQSYVNLEGGGELTFRMTQQGDMRMTGRFTTNSGEMKYQLPVIPLKTFSIVQGSYVEFTGDVMNPTLNIEAKERTKALVAENDKQRSVAFDVGVRLTKPLNDMGLEFTIEAPEDLTVQNQLATMSAEQRGKAAVTMMATGMYMTDETMMSGSGFRANNALNAFLQNEIQNIAGSALKTIDINLGVESGTSETGSSTTDYSFQFAKRFWGNRISVIIGGKVSTGADAVNSAQSFINNISVEYRLDQGATRYVKCFYDRNTQDPLEGQLTKTGAGIVLRRKTDRLGELFIFKKKR